MLKLTTENRSHIFGKKYTVKDLVAKGIEPPIYDERFCVVVIDGHMRPNETIYRAMHQDYSAHFVGDEIINMSDSELGEAVVRNLLKGKRGHFGPLEHPQLTLMTGFFPHSTMQQIRTHRIGITFDVQSYRYTNENILAAATKGENDPAYVEDAFYMRPMGSYSSRDGKNYEYTYELRKEDLEWNLKLAKRYKARFDMGFSEEHCRGLIAAEYRQHFGYSATFRSHLHVLDLRAKADAAPEVRTLSELSALALEDWCPEVMQWYLKNRMRKAVLSP